MLTSMAAELQIVISLLITQLSYMEAGAAGNADLRLADLAAHELIEDIELLHSMQVAILKERASAATKYFQRLNTEVRDLAAEKAETFFEYVLNGQA